MWKNEFIKRCFDNENVDDFSYGMLIKDKHIPNRLYRYRKFNVHSLDEIKNQHIKVVSPKTFNDLLDTRAKVDFRVMFQGDNPKIKDSYKKHMGNHMTQEKLDELLSGDDWYDKILREASTQAAKAHNDAKLSPGYIENALKTVVDKQIIEINEVAGEMWQSIVHCCCFSETKDNNAMWSHYAQNSTGFCIEYDMTKFTHRDFQRRFMYLVIYTDELPDATETIRNRQPQTKTSFLATWVSVHKKTEWSYEKEWRLIFQGWYKQDTYIRFPAASAIY
ncbi:MAG: DUF2971 domain-containing protein [Clostridia bacterium]|nr:DUF2971 domain-containing protein [Clostridia bacterium]